MQHEMNEWARELANEYFFSVEKVWTDKTVGLIMLSYWLNEQ